MNQLTKNFSLEELTITDHREYSNEPNESERQNLVRLANFLEQVKFVLGNVPIMVNSAYRSAQVNAAVGSKETSQHRLGCAADLRVPGMAPDQVVQTIIGSQLEFDQVIREFDRWTHISVPNTEGDKARRMALIIDKMGTRKYA